jgi:formylglycine-generating enzyme required for sulfatase activity
MLGNALGKEPKQAPKELTVDLGRGVKLEMVLIPAGEFLMGSPESDKNTSRVEKPQHRVRITKPFYFGKYLVTQEQWEAVMGNNPSDFKGPRQRNPTTHRLEPGNDPSAYKRYPVECVTWDDCQAFCVKLTALRRGTFRLPTEAQWEYACRAGSTGKYCFGDDEAQLGEYAWYWYAKNSVHGMQPVGEKKPNSWGLYDMHGNVWEWCQDWYDSGYYAGAPTRDPTGPATGSGRVARGGCWAAPAAGCRSAFRCETRPGLRLAAQGLRVCRVLAK